MSDPRTKNIGHTNKRQAAAGSIVRRVTSKKHAPFQDFDTGLVEVRDEVVTQAASMHWIAPNQFRVKRNVNAKETVPIWADAVKLTCAVVKFPLSRVSDSL